MGENQPKNCPQCGAASPHEAIFCSTCGKPLQTPLLEIPFEARGAQGFWPSLVATWKSASLDPNNFYPLVGKSRDTSSAIWFYMTVQIAIFFFYFILAIPFRVYDVALLSTKAAQEYGNLFAHLTVLAVVGFTLLTVVIAPVFIYIWFYLYAFGWQVSLLMVKGAPLGFQTTLRVLAYASAPTIIPCAGPIWSLIMKIIGLSHAHQTEIWRPLVAYLINVMLLVLCVGMLLVMAGIFVWMLIHAVPH